MRELSHSTNFVQLLARSSNFARTFAIRHPEWWTWLFSFYIWGWLLSGTFFYATNENPSGRLIYCFSDVTQYTESSVVDSHSILKQSQAFTALTQTLSKGAIPWIIMIVAMMFPLLNEAIRHMAFAVKPRDRDLGILFFLLGYTLAWCLIAPLFLLIPIGVDAIIGVGNEWARGALAALVFVLTAVVIWFPSRATTMARCAQTMPIRIEPFVVYLDGIKYGVWMGIACIRMCWLPMLALMLAHHSVFLMFIVTVVVVIERYFVPHTSKLPSYAFGVIAILMVFVELYKYI